MEAKPVEHAAAQVKNNSLTPNKVKWEGLVVSAINYQEVGENLKQSSTPAKKIVSKASWTQNPYCTTGALLIFTLFNMVNYFSVFHQRIRVLNKCERARVAARRVHSCTR